MKSFLTKNLFFLFLLFLLAVGFFFIKENNFSHEQRGIVSHDLSLLSSLIGVSHSSSKNQNGKSENADVAEATLSAKTFGEPSPMDHLSEKELEEFPGGIVLEATEIPGPKPTQKIRFRLLQTHFKYPFLRTEEVFDSEKKGVVSRREMVASHFLVTLGEDENPQAFFDKMGDAVTSMERVTQDAPLYRVTLATKSLEALPSAMKLAQNITGGVGEPDFLSHARNLPPWSSDSLYFSKQWAFWPQHYFTCNFNGAYTEYTFHRVEEGEQPKVLWFGDKIPCYPGVHAEEAWDIRTDASSVIVAVIDSGIRYTHDALKDNMWHNPTPGACGKEDGLYGCNFYDDNNDPVDRFYHGTMCAGIIGANGAWNGCGTFGVAWKVQLMACCFLDNHAGGVVSDEISCIDYAINHGASILNCSYGNYIYSQAEYNAFRRAQRRGVIVVTADGNEGINSDEYLSFPSCYQLDNIINVTAVDLKNAMPSWSNSGPHTVLLGAPGEAIESTTISDNEGNKSDLNFTMGNGTSFAAPFVAGTMALLKAQFPNENYRMLIARLIRSVDPSPSLKGNTITGGRLNIARALTGLTPKPSEFYVPAGEWPLWAQSWEEWWKKVEYILE